MIDLNLYRKNLYTNSGVRPCPGYGEDGVILKIFEVIGSKIMLVRSGLILQLLSKRKSGIY